MAADQGSPNAAGDACRGSPPAMWQLDKVRDGTASIEAMLPADPAGDVAAWILVGFRVK